MLLIHQIPAKPAYQRVKVWRRLQGLGAVAIKNAVHALPANEQSQEDFEWLLKEIRDGGGEALICEARLVDGLSDEQVEAMFNAAREADYDALAKEIRTLAEALGADTAAARGELRSRLSRLKAGVAQTASIDFFGANGRETVDGLLAGLEATLGEEGAMAGTTANSLPVSGDRDALTGRVWVTRQRVYIDRIASAWLIRRFIDSAATFKFVAGKGYVPQPGELRFDMFEAEFTHEGDRCTFEVLLSKADPNDPALIAIAEIVHDIDLKDAKFAREETSGIAHLMTGLCATSKDDMQRVDRGSAVLDDLYEYFRKRRN
ncbi:MAG TPA: chromate resistance protein ChrB domain-containing protein [Acetobacteraceae bacterium]|nr:chromate resistance protein ChrB domain-containing protein [Acetobacteraceae bacterium]